MRSARVLMVTGLLIAAACSSRSNDRVRDRGPPEPAQSSAPDKPRSDAGEDRRDLVAHDLSSHHWPIIVNVPANTKISSHDGAGDPYLWLELEQASIAIRHPPNTAKFHSPMGYDRMLRGDREDMAELTLHTHVVSSDGWLASWNGRDGRARIVVAMRTVRSQAVGGEAWAGT